MKKYDYYQNRPNPKNHICATAIIIRNNKVLMGLREYETGNPLWTFPGGRCDYGEEPQTGLCREVKEEIGVSDLEIIKSLGIKEGVYRGTGQPDQVHVFHCHTKQEPKLMEPEKFIEWRWIDVQNLPKNMIDLKDKLFIKAVLEN